MLMKKNCWEQFLPEEKLKLDESRIYDERLFNFNFMV